MKKKRTSDCRRIGFLLLALCLFALSACSGSTSTSSVTLDELEEAMLSADPSLPEMTTIDSRSENADALFSYLSDVDYAKINRFFLSYCSDGKEADEIAVVELKSSSDVTAMRASLQSHVDGRIALYSTYGPDQVAKAEQALLFEQGNYVVLIISDRTADVRAAFETKLQAE
jgi:hypothetical protein